MGLLQNGRTRAAGLWALPLWLLSGLLPAMVLVVPKSNDLRGVLLMFSLIGWPMYLVFWSRLFLQARTGDFTLSGTFLLAILMFFVNVAVAFEGCRYYRPGLFVW